MLRYISTKEQRTSAEVEARQGGNLHRWQENGHKNRCFWLDKNHFTNTFYNFASLSHMLD
jgi:hypothetical protein